MFSKELDKRLKSGLVDPVYLFYGNEDYVKEVYVERIKESVLKNGQGEYYKGRIDGINRFCPYDV